MNTLQISADYIAKCIPQFAQQAEVEFQAARLSTGEIIPACLCVTTYHRRLFVRIAGARFALSTFFRLFTVIP